MQRSEFENAVIEAVVAFKEVLKRWDALGTNKDDDFGDVQEAMEIAREKLVVLDKLVGL